MTDKLSEQSFDSDSSKEDEAKAYHFYSQQHTSKNLYFYISGSVGDPEDYVDMIHQIRQAGPHDTVYLYINTPGGQIRTGAQIIAAVRNSPAKVVTVAEGEVCSLGTLLFLSGDEMVIQDHCLFMIHNHSGGAYGKGHEYLAAGQATAKWFELMAREYYIGFLTEDEFNQMIQGKDFWFTSDEVRRRLKKYVKHLERVRKEKEKT